MSPSLGIRYSSEGGSGWLGEGWNLSVPSITLDTRWGVPRYDLADETETYMLSGSMLSTTGDDGQMSVAHRGDRIARKPDRRFYTRQGGDFSRIIRKGSSPADYYWEVTDRQGVKYTYGGKGAVLKGTITDIDGNTREVVSEWKLARVEETHGDYIEYVYETAEEEVRGGLTAKAVYLKEVHAGNAGQEPHTVVLFEGGKVKQLKSNSARYGYLTSSNRLLEKVTVNFRGETLRSYTFAYRNGAFFREVLEGVKQFDSEGNEFAFQRFDYYDDVQSGNGYVPFKDGSETWKTHDDGLDAGFINPLQVAGGRFSDKPTALGGTTSSSVSGSFYAGVGVVDGSPWKGNTVGGAYSYSSDNSKGLSTLVDLNGDGLPDKVYRKDGALYYRPQIPNGVNEAVTYGNAVKVSGITGFSTSKSSTNTGGGKATVGWMCLTAEVGVDVTKTRTKTTEYFSDINGDGLVDLVSNGVVYFNHLEFDADGTAIPTFTESSANTPSPIIYSGKIDASVITISPEEQAEAIQASPMEDMVRVWQAPKAGTVSISGTVSLIAPSGDYDAAEYAKADGVRVAIQKGSVEYWNKAIAKGDASAYEAGVPSLAVNKGDRIYFRVQSGTEETSNGAFDNVRWSPVITYLGTEEIQPNGYSTTVYKPAEGAIFDVNTIVRIDEGTPLKIAGTFTKPVTTDDVTIRVLGSNDLKDANGNDNPAYVQKEVYSRTYPAASAVNGEEVIADIANTEGFLNFNFEVSSTSNIDWQHVRWTSEVTYTDSIGEKQTVIAPAHYATFAGMVSEGNSYAVASEDTVLTVIPDLVVKQAFSGKATLTVKSADELFAKETITINDGVAVGDTLKLEGLPKDTIWFEYHCPDMIADDAISSSRIVILRDTTGLNNDSIAAGFYAVKANEGFGMLYRGWGGFVYNAAEGRYAKPIDEALLKLPESENDNIDPRTMPFTPIGTDQTTLAAWVGQRPEIYLTADEAGTARLGEQDVILTNPLENNADIAGISGDCLQGTGAAAVTQVSTNKSTVKQGGAMGVTYNDATGHATTDVTMMDMNGDGYPDVIAGGTIQYTNTLGGISGEIYRGIGSSNTNNASQAWGYGGNPVASVSDIVKLIKSGKEVSSNEKSSWQAQFSISGSVPKNTDEAVEAFADLNGDGLPDKILADKTVRLNLGYAFSEAVNWDLDRIQSGKSLSYSAGGGAGAGGGIGDTTEFKGKEINKASGSFMAGFGLVTSESEEEFNLTDVNSDGLPDKVWKDGNNVTVALNMGNSFDAPMQWKGANALNESASTSESVNAAFTLSINIPVAFIKISTNPGVSTGHSISRPRYGLQDVDGDGYLDIVESDSERELKVTRSAIGRTNMLRSVVNSLGGSFELDYTRTLPTYGLPGGKWVMSTLTVDDGIRDDGPVMKTAFEYRDGKRDRHEREFLGFGEVITRNLDTENAGSVYRQSVQEYDVANYYTQGNLLASSVKDAAGNKFTETRNEYGSYSVTADGDNYTFNEQVLCSDRASAFVPLRYTANMQYEGQAQGMVTSEAWNEYYLNGYHGELKSYKFSDKGTLGADGNGSFDYQTAIQYTSNAGRHIFGLPTNVTVTGGDGTVYHNVSAAYNTNYPNHLTKITQQLGDGEAVTDYRYDSYGNILQKTLPANANGQRMWYKYRYEPEMNMYVERIEDAFGYRSEAGNFDYRYGIALERRDLNNFYYETDIDNMGRITGVRGPNELATGVPYIIAFEYQPKAEFGEDGITTPAYAVTRHYDIQHPDDDMETVTFVDGFGRPVQVKKDGVVTAAEQGSAPSDENVMIVSGRNVYDAFGRVAKTYYPTTEALGTKTAFNTAFDGVTPTVMVYDVLDRATSVTLPDNSETKTGYTLNTNSRALVTTVTDALGNRQATHTNGSGKTVKTVQQGPDGEITTSFEYDGIDRLIRVTDTEGNVTTSTYDMGDRRTEVNHPASGIMSFTYDALGNVLTKQTANLAEEGKFITYDYDYHRLVGINYPDHPENNVKYYYGGRNASQNRIGRLMLREDGTGAIEYFYGKMGEVTKTRRTLIVPNQAIATYVTQWTYDSHNRLLEMIYPDEEKITYSYNLGGLLEKVRGYKTYGYDYVNKLGYDKFEQRTYLKYCNGAETFYTYDPQRRRLQNLAVSSKGNAIMDNAYTYDAVSNVLSVVNNAPVPQAGNAGGRMAHTYTYDNLYRLATASGTYTGADNKAASYTLEMGYDDMHRITSKRQHLTQQNVQFDGTLNVGYDLTYTYSDKKKFQLSGVRDLNYRTEGEIPSETVENGHAYRYDANGNLVYVNTGRVKNDSIFDERMNERKFIWDEENRLKAVDENGFVSNYWYDADGERTVKTSGEGEAVYVNSEFAGGRTNTAKFSLYVSPYLVANQGGRYTKHIYIGSQRIVSKIGDFASYGSDPRRIEYAGSETDGLSVNYAEKYTAQLDIIRKNYSTFDMPYNGTDNDDYANGEGFCCNDGSIEAAQARARALEGNFQDSDAYEKLQFYYHPDHLGSSSYITNLEGEVVQHIEYVPFGEVFFEERNSIWNTPYLFNAKEFDEETGLYYYGARYYDSRLSLWMSTDPKEMDFLNISTYCYAANSPVKFIDPDGESPKAIITAAKYIKKAYSIYRKTGKLTPQSLKQAGISEVVDIAGDLFTIFDGDASLGDKVGAGVDLIVGTNLNNKGQKAAKNFLGIKDDKAQKTYQTYTKKNLETGEVYVGRTSGTGSPHDNVNRRDRNHHMNEKGFGPAELDKSSSNYDAIRGREQHMIDIHGGAKSEGGTSGNTIRGVSHNNKNAAKYENATKKEFGN